MAQPTPYALSFSFTDFAAAHPSLPLPGASLDAELQALVVTLSGVLANLAKLQRDDGALKNQLVTLDSLSPAALLTLGAGSAWTPKGAWATGLGYISTDVVTSGTGSYVCAATHIAAADVAARAVGLPAVATRGSFMSEQAIHATEVLRTRYAGFEPLNVFGLGSGSLVYQSRDICNFEINVKGLV